MTGPRRIRKWWLALAFVCGLAAAMAAEELILRMQGNRLDFSAPRVHYLTGRPLARLKNAEPVAFDIQVKLAAQQSSNVLRTNTARFVISYDLWEERYAVTKTTAPRKAASHLTAAEAEEWCIHEMSVVDVSGIAANQPLWARMDIRAEDEKDSRLFGRDNISDQGISLTSLIERLSRPPKASQPHWELEAGPVTLEQLRR